MTHYSTALQLDAATWLAVILRHVVQHVEIFWTELTQLEAVLFAVPSSSYLECSQDLF